jgi:hypothetical protein
LFCFYTHQYKESNINHIYNSYKTTLSWFSIEYDKINYVQLIKLIFQLSNCFLTLITMAGSNPPISPCLFYTFFFIKSFHCIALLQTSSFIFLSEGISYTQFHVPILHLNLYLGIICILRFIGNNHHYAKSKVSPLLVIFLAHELEEHTLV